jgi:hypothetical protein
VAQDKDYVIELGRTVHELFAEGNPDPSATEIAEANFPGRVLGGEIVEGVRKRLGKIRDFLEENYSEFPVCLVSQTYYVRFRENPPTTAAEARRCLPVGHGVKQAGIRMQTGADDLIWQEAISLNLHSGAGKIRKSADRAINAYDNNRLSEADAARMLTEAQGRSQPGDPETAEHLLEALPAGADDE